MTEKVRICSTMSGAVGLGSLAAALGLCCTVPWAVTLLGVTGAVAFARLALLLPYALIGAAALLTYAFWLVYRQKPLAEGARAVRQLHSLRWMVWIAGFAVSALAVVALTARVVPA
jgi:hypothetical protein